MYEGLNINSNEAVMLTDNFKLSCISCVINLFYYTNKAFAVGQKYTFVLNIHYTELCLLKNEICYQLSILQPETKAYFWSCCRKRLTATEALDHPFINFAHRRGLGDRIHLDRHKAFMFRRKWEVSCLFCSILLSC